MYRSPLQFIGAEASACMGCPSIPSSKDGKDSMHEQLDLPLNRYPTSLNN